MVRKPQDEPNGASSGADISSRFELLRLLSRTSVAKDKFTFFLAALLAIANGVGFPLLPVLFARTMSRFSQLYNSDLRDALGPSGGAPLDDLEVTADVQRTSQIMLGLGAAVAAGTLVMAYLQIKTARNVSARIRRMYFGALLRQDLAWYHRNPAGTLTARVSAIDTIERALGQTAAELVRDISATLAGFILAFTNSWKMTLIIFSFMPIIAVVGFVVNVVSNRVSQQAQESSGNASAAASESFTTIRTVLAFDGARTEEAIFENALENAYKYNVKRSIVNGFGTGFLMLVLMSIFSVGFIVGNRLIAIGQVTLDRAIAASALVPAVFSAFRIANAQRLISSAAATAKFVLHVISNEPKIDPLSEEGEIIEDFSGGISFRDVQFSHSDGSEDNSDGKPVLKGISFELKPGTSNGLCGHTGSGKSTIVSLIQRLYDIKEGKILLDGKLDIRDANIRWLRSQIGHVEQKPRLFQGTIRENIEMGVPSGSFSDINSEEINMDTVDVDFEDVIKAAKIANAHDFIEALPNGYETLLGESGTLLSGGQKQRIAIARSLMSDPKILLLDECTANLDNKSEAAFQEALQSAAKNRTTLIVAHKLGTIRRCDNIFVLNKGQIVEEGTHQVLNAKEGGVYKSLMNPQEIKGTLQDTTTNSEETVSEKNPAGVYMDGDDPAEDSHGELDPLTLIPESAAHGSLGVFKASRLLFSLKLSRHTWTALGLFGSVVLGISWPLAAACISELLVLGDVSEKPGQLKLWASLLVCCGAAAFVGVLLQNIFLSISGERFTKNAKQLYFNSVLAKDLEFFDKKENSVGTLVFRINDQIGQLKSLTVDLLGSVSIAVVSVFMGVFLACFYCWRVALIAFIFMPGIILSGYSIFRVGPDYNNPQVADSVRVASEALHGIETVFSLGKEVDMMKKYNAKMASARIGNSRSMIISLIASAYVAASPFCLFGAAFWIGSVVLLSGQCDLLGLNKATLCIFLGSVLIGELTYSVPNLRRARIAATDFFGMIDEKRKQDESRRSREGTEVERSISGEVAFRDVEFSYASRPLVKVLKGLTTSIESKKMLALVGESGSGKSTIINLIQRFYAQRTGSILIDATDVDEYNISNLRNQLGLVDQEPKLFNRSIRDNISYGLPHTEGVPVTDSEISAAAKIAGAHEFILRMPQGYDTLAGEGGGKLSGGERQRIAIARSLLRKPKVLLLDEATSALDSNTEQLIQQSLNAFESTIIVVAHRLSTIRNADKIVVLRDGAIVEEGTHDSLLRKNGEYAKMLRISGSNNNNSNT